MEEVYLLLGANLGDRRNQLSRAESLIAEQIGPIRGKSSLYESESWGGVGKQPVYLNQVLKVETNLTPTEVLAGVQAIENALGRVRTGKWGARVIDIDLLFYGNAVIDLPELQVPHPYFQERNFALQPMCELDPDFVHPLLGRTVAALMSDSTDPLRVWKI